MNYFLFWKKLTLSQSNILSLTELNLLLMQEKEFDDKLIQYAYDRTDD